MQAGASDSSTAQSGTAQSGSGLNADFQSMIAAVQSGDSTAAQQALAKVQGDMTSLGHGGHHHHHHGGAAPASTTPPATDPLSIDDSTDLFGAPVASETQA